MLKNISLIFLLAIFASLILPNQALAAEGDNFNPNYIISDADILNSKAMSLADIQNFLQEKGGFLANYITENNDGVRKTAAEIIYDAAVNNYDCQGVSLSENPSTFEKQTKCLPVKINPRFLLVLLQKEQSLTEEKNPKQSQLDWATGYGCPDGGGCNDRWKGFGKQVNSAALQFYDYMVNPRRYTYKVANTYTFNNPYAADENKKTSIVQPANIATAALYNYTPHVYNGNYNFYKIWQRYFAQKLIEGSLVQAEGELGVWLIKDGVKRPFLSGNALKSRYDTNKILKISSADLAQYKKGAPIKFPQYSIVRAPSGSIYLLVDDKKRKIIDQETFRQIGFNPEEILEASWEDVNSYQNGTDITASSTYPTGVLLQDKETGGVYWVEEGLKHPLLDKAFLKTKFKNNSVVKADKAELDKYPKADPIKFDDGEILRSNVSPAVYVISEGKKRPIASGEIFEKLGYNWKNIITVSSKVLYLYENGEVIK